MRAVGIPQGVILDTVQEKLMVATISKLMVIFFPTSDE